MYMGVKKGGAEGVREMESVGKNVERSEDAKVGVAAL